MQERALAQTRALVAHEVVDPVVQLFAVAVRLRHHQNIVELLEALNRGRCVMLLSIFDILEQKSNVDAHGDGHSDHHQGQEEPESDLGN